MGRDHEPVADAVDRADHVLVQAMVGNARAPEIRGLRVSPNVYTTPAELDRFVAALVAAARG